jgi:hypothetical protein
LHAICGVVIICAHPAHTGSGSSSFFSLSIPRRRYRPSLLLLPLLGCAPLLRFLPVQPLTQRLMLPRQFQRCSGSVQTKLSQFVNGNRTLAACKSCLSLSSFSFCSICLISKRSFSTRAFSSARSWFLFIDEELNVHRHLQLSIVYFLLWNIAAEGGGGVVRAISARADTGVVWNLFARPQTSLISADWVVDNQLNRGSMRHALLQYRTWLCHRWEFRGLRNMGAIAARAKSEGEEMGFSDRRKMRKKSKNVGAETLIAFVQHQRMSQ